MSGKSKIVFGDFQTPLGLARQIACFVHSVSGDVSAVVEPTCGQGNFLLASAEAYGANVFYHGFDIHPEHVRQARETLRQQDGIRARVLCQDFYAMDWRQCFASLPPNTLVIGNPPWVTNAALGAMGAGNLPKKSNFQRRTGLAAKTGKANFDISEWMLIRLLESLRGKQAVLAMLCKTATARRVLCHAWKSGFDVSQSSLHLVDAREHFGVSVDACLLLTRTGHPSVDRTAVLYQNLDFDQPVQTFGLVNGELIANVDAYREFRYLDGVEYRRWRSGVKHDAARVMELRPTEEGYLNGLEEKWQMESDFLFPLLKSSDLANGRLGPTRYVLVTQQRIADETSEIEITAPLTWRYLLASSEYLDQRRSSIYANRPRFAVFGIGPYTFSPWKVGVSGLHGNLRFRAIGPHAGKPVVLDDTCYFLPCESAPEAKFFADLLNSDVARRFLGSLIFLDSKRPVTIDVLRRLDLGALAGQLGREAEASRYLGRSPFETGSQQLLLFQEELDR